MTPPERSALKRGYHECKIAKLQKAFARLQRKAQARLTHEPTAAAAGAAARLTSTTASAAAGGAGGATAASGRRPEPNRGYDASALGEGLALPPQRVMQLGFPAECRDQAGASIHERRRRLYNNVIRCAHEDDETRLYPNP